MANTFWPNMKMIGFLITVFCSPIFCTAQITDDFSDGNLSLNPAWTGNIGNFYINNSFQLQLNAEGAGNSFLSTNNKFIQNCEWQFWIKLGFSPSANNNCRIYLIADNPDLTHENLNAYFLQFGESGSNDAIELFRQNGSEIYSVCRGTSGLVSSSFQLRVKVTRTENGLWELFIDRKGGYLFASEASGSDPGIITSGYFGFSCLYTSSNNQKFYFDDIYVGIPIIDETAPELQSLEIVDSNHLKLIFSEDLNPDCIQNLENFSVDQGIGNPISIQADESLQKLDLFFPNSFEENQAYQLSLQNIRDFSGNTIEPDNIEFTYFVARTHDLVINEILFDPLTGCEEYVEIYNRSQKILNFKKIKFGRIKYDFPNSPDTSLCKISDTSIFIHPNEYWVISTSPEYVKKCYFTNYPEHFIEVSSLPDLINQEGHLFVVSDSGILIDEAKYREDMHHPILNFTDGVALEKVHFDASGMNENNWQSATQNVGFGTPAYQNSQFSEQNKSTDKIKISPEVFSPDQDGIDDLLSISLSLNDGGNTVNIFVFNSNGQQIRYLVKNESVGMNAVYFWNGLDDQYEQLPVGIYIIYVELFNLNGHSDEIKKTVVLARQIK